MNITCTEIDLADTLLLNFCKRVESLYGKDTITPNMHLHCQCLLDYGPTHNFWLFAYERYNGILESFPTNHRSLEIQLMKRFLREFKLSTSLPIPDLFKEEVGEFMSHQLQPKLQGSVRTTVHGKTNRRFDPSRINSWSIDSIRSEVEFPSVYVRSALHEEVLTRLLNIYSSLYPSLKLEQSSLNTVCKKFSQVKYQSTNFACKSNPVVYARNPARMEEIRCALLDYFLVHSFHDGEHVVEHVFASVMWLKEHPARHSYGKPVELWWKDVFEEELNHLLPIQLLVCQSVYCDIIYELQTVLLVVPVENIPKFFPSHSST